jgi:xylitol oxidase
VSATNWAGNLTYHAREAATPATVAEAQEIVRRAPKLRALGSRHCFNDIADTDALHLSLEKQRHVIAIDAAARTVTVEGGVRYGDLAPALHAAGFALHNLASLPHISIAGAVGTATHGSGVKLGNLATAVTQIEFIRADGELVTLSRAQDGDTFAGAVVHLGALGVITKLTLKIEPAYDVRQDIWLDLPVSELLANFDAILSAGTSVSLFTTWQSDVINQVWIKSGADTFTPRASLYGAQAATTKMHPLAGHDATACTEQGGVPGPWHERLPHFRMDFTPSSGAELQAEYFVPRERAIEGVRILQRWGRALGPFIFVSEVRTIAADDLWLSPACKRDVVAFHFTLRQDVPGVPRLLYELEAQLALLNPVPHWGKLFSLSAAKVQAAYPRLADFRALAATHDPQGKFRNRFVEKYVFGDG